MKEIVILGGGFAGAATARSLERRVGEGEARITLVSRENFTLFTPLLPEVCSGGIETRHVVTPLRAQLKRTRFVLGEIGSIDLNARSVEVHHAITASRIMLAYDHLVIALGSVTSTFGLPGVAEHSLPLKTLEDAETLRNHIIATLEQADVEPDPARRKRLLTYIVVGGGYTGCEATGELADLLSDIGRFYRNVTREDISIVLLEAGKALLADLPLQMGRYTAKHLTRRGVDVRVGDGVASLDADEIVLTSGVRIRSASVIWSAGIRPAPIIRDLPLEHARNGGIVVERDMSVPGRPGLWAIGDSAWIPRAKKGGWYPPTAQHAIREGPVLAANIVASMRGERTKPFRYRSLGTMASLGARRGVAALPGGMILTGFGAWLLWRSYYLSRLPGLDRKVRVALDWTLGLVFPRDIAEFRVYSDRSATSSPTQPKS